MAQIHGFKYVENPTGGGHVQGHWPAPAAPAFESSYDDHDDEHGHHHGMKSVLAKVKEKAKKFKRSLSKKRHGHDTGDNDGHFTREYDGVEEDPENHGAPMCKSEWAPNSHKEAAAAETEGNLREKGIQHPDGLHTKTLEHQDSFKERDLEGQLEPYDRYVLADKDVPEDPAVGNGAAHKTITETVSEMLAPAYAAVTEATRMMSSKIQSPRAGDRDREAMSKQVWDKGVSVKEYLLQKLEPGEGEKALSEVITEAMSPKKGAGGGGGEVGVVDKVKGAVTSLLGMEKDAGSEIPWGSSASKDTKTALSTSKSQPLPVSMNAQVIQVSKSQPIPLPPSLRHTAMAQHNQPFYNNAHAGVVEGGKPLGELLRAYSN